ncbi:MAG: AmmeMemoRadiSam system radical SAM enzyme [Candidatus Omnitrophica bacterium]|nr:AmmeMemoRadiSam system radical SAM enzyme [Candidatus Omnitrophota bacterium]MDD5671935.1 AmmeMemoRadiSam system radical SAM enzyme [Candidatus Omnitrophota bacterium]
MTQPIPAAAVSGAAPAIQCTLCPRGCTMAEYERGRCKVRVNKGGQLYTLVYGKPCAVHIDPIEKKPFFHFLPATAILSIATAGCCLECKYCQNWEISQAWPEETINQDLSPEAVVKGAVASRCRSIAYTYTEPTIFYEYMYDTSVLARRMGLRNVSVTCGYINPEPLRELCQVLDAANVDLKGFTDEFYVVNCGGRLQPVMDCILTMKKLGVHVEITNLVVPTKNDNMDLIRQMCAWVVQNTGADTPLHFSRFSPDYRLRQLPPTPIETLVKARDIALAEGLRYVYVGNVPGEDYENTICPGCKKPVIRRMGYRVVDFEIDRETSQCLYCHYKIAGVWK